MPAYCPKKKPESVFWSKILKAPLENQMAAAVGSPNCLLLHRFLHRPPPPASSLSLFFKPLLISNTPSIPRPRIIPPSLPALPSRPRLFCCSPILPHSPLSPEASVQEEVQTQRFQNPDEEEIDDGDNVEESESEIDNLLDNKEDAQAGLQSSLALKRSGVKPPSLTVKEKKELASYAHSLGKKLKSQLVGKSGVTANLAASFIENLESNELLKVKIHGTCPGELEDAVTQLEEATGSVVVGQIGRTVILYRPSITKLKAEEKRQQSRKVFMRRKTYSKPTSVEFQKKGGRPRTNGRDSRRRVSV